MRLSLHLIYTRPIIPLHFPFHHPHMASNNVEYFDDFLLQRQQVWQAKRRQRHQKLRELNQKKAGQEPLILQDLVTCDDKITDDEAVAKGQITSVIDFTLVDHFYKVEVRYRDHKSMTIAKREEITRKNTRALLDFYENRLQLKNNPYRSK